MKRAKNWIDCDFDDDLNLDFEFAKPLPPKKITTPVQRKTSAPTVKHREKAPTKNLQLQQWSDKHAPKNSADLAVNVKKVSEVKVWLEFNLKSKRPGILLLLGPPGSGKTATIKVLAQEVNCYVQEWSNPLENIEYSGDQRSEVPYISQSKSFNNFMIRANKYLSLGHGKSKIILLEDLPNFIYKNLDDFHNVLRNGTRLFPIVIIQTDEQKVKDILPQEFIEELLIHVINFNAVTATNMAKALGNIAQLEKMPLPDKNALTSLAASTNGDIRAAINAFQIGCATKQYRKKVFEGSTSLQSSKKKPKNSTQNTNTDSNLAVIGGKNVNLDLFHALGKVLYAKRTDEMESREKKLLSHDQNKARYKLEVDPEELLENIPMSTHSFAAFLHQSYLDFFTDIKDLSNAAENLSICDPFFHEWTHTGKVSLTDYGGLIAIRGLCYHNKDRSRNFSGMKTFHKPEWYQTVKLSRQRQETLQKYFRTNTTYSKNEVAMLLGPMFSEYFLPAIGSGVNDNVIEACRFKDLPRKKISNSIDRSVSDFSLGYEDENDNKKNIINTVEAVDFLIVDDED